MSRKKNNGGIGGAVNGRRNENAEESVANISGGSKISVGDGKELNARTNDISGGSKIEQTNKGGLTTGKAEVSEGNSSGSFNPAHVETSEEGKVSDKVKTQIDIDKVQTQKDINIETGGSKINATTKEGMDGMSVKDSGGNRSNIHHSDENQGSADITGNGLADGGESTAYRKKQTEEDDSSYSGLGKQNDNAFGSLFDNTSEEEFKKSDESSGKPYQKTQQTPKLSNGSKASLASGSSTYDKQNESVSVGQASGVEEMDDDFRLVSDSEAKDDSGITSQGLSDKMSVGDSGLSDNVSTEKAGSSKLATSQGISDKLAVGSNSELTKNASTESSFNVGNAASQAKAATTDGSDKASGNVSVTDGNNEASKSSDGYLLFRAKGELERIGLDKAKGFAEQGDFGAGVKEMRHLMNLTGMTGTYNSLVTRGIRNRVTDLGNTTFNSTRYRDKKTGQEYTKGEYRKLKKEDLKNGTNTISKADIERVTYKKSAGDLFGSDIATKKNMHKGLMGKASYEDLMTNKKAIDDFIKAETKRLGGEFINPENMSDIEIDRILLRKKYKDSKGKTHEISDELEFALKEKKKMKQAGDEMRYSQTRGNFRQWLNAAKQETGDGDFDDEESNIKQEMGYILAAGHGAKTIGKGIVHGAINGRYDAGRFANWVSEKKEGRIFLNNRKMMLGDGVNPDDPYFKNKWKVIDGKHKDKAVDLKKRKIAAKSKFDSAYDHPVNAIMKKFGINLYQDRRRKESLFDKLMKLPSDLAAKVDEIRVAIMKIFGKLFLTSLLITAIGIAILGVVQIVASILPESASEDSDPDVVEYGDRLQNPALARVIGDENTLYGKFLDEYNRAAYGYGDMKLGQDKYNAIGMSTTYTYEGVGSRTNFYKSLIATATTGCGNEVRDPDFFRMYIEDLAESILQHPVAQCNPQFEGDQYGKDEIGNPSGTHQVHDFVTATIEWTQSEGKTITYMDRKGEYNEEGEHFPITKKYSGAGMPGYTYFVTTDGDVDPSSPVFTTGAAGSHSFATMEKHNEELLAEGKPGLLEGYYKLDYAPDKLLPYPRWETTVNIHFGCIDPTFDYNDEGDPEDKPDGIYKGKNKTVRVVNYTIEGKKDGGERAQEVSYDDTLIPKATKDDPNPDVWGECQWDDTPGHQYALWYIPADRIQEDYGRKGNNNKYDTNQYTEEEFVTSNYEDHNNGGDHAGTSAADAYMHWFGAYDYKNKKFNTQYGVTARNTESETAKTSFPFASDNQGWTGKKKDFIKWDDWNVAANSTGIADRESVNGFYEMDDDSWINYLYSQFLLPGCYIDANGNVKEAIGGASSGIGQHTDYNMVSKLGYPLNDADQQALINDLIQQNGVMQMDPETQDAMISIITEGVKWGTTGNIDYSFGGSIHGDGSGSQVTDCSHFIQWIAQKACEMNDNPKHIPYIATAGMYGNSTYPQVGMNNEQEALKPGTIWVNSAAGGHTVLVLGQTSLYGGGIVVVDAGAPGEGAKLVVHKDAASLRAYENGGDSSNGEWNYYYSMVEAVKY